MSGRLGELLVRENLISVQQLRKAQEEQQKTGTRIGTALIKVGAIEESKLTDFLSKQYGVPAINLKEFDVEPDIIKLVPKDVAEKHLVVPVNRAGSALIVAMCDPSNIYAVDDLKFLTGYNIEAVVASEPAIREAIERYYAEKGPSLEDIVGGMDDDVEMADSEAEVGVEEAARAADDAPVIKLVNLILKDAIGKRASDIHIEPYEKDFRVRFRIDGVMYEVMRPPIKLKSAIISRVKIMAQLDISERRLPQDGRIKIKLGGGKEMDFRVSVCPTLFGEKIVMRLLDKSNLQLDMTKLGFDPEPLKWFKEAIDRPYGMVLVTGPTGSGKTTTLYGALTRINTPEVKILTVEDPVEYQLKGINQMPLNPKIGLTFASGLRAFLRQDPDIIMVGEIRDKETAQIAIEASLTGHLVFSTVHTNDSAGAVTRLVEMGVEPFLVSSSLMAVMAQRLVRRVCKECRELYQPTDEEISKLGMSMDRFRALGGDKVYRARGCPACNKVGYRGRTGIYELLVLDDDIRQLVLKNVDSGTIKKKAMEKGMLCLLDDGALKVARGETTIAEILSVTQEDL